MTLYQEIWLDDVYILCRKMMTAMMGFQESHHQVEMVIQTVCTYSAQAAGLLRPIDLAFHVPRASYQSDWHLYGQAMVCICSLQCLHAAQSTSAP